MSLDNCIPALIATGDIAPDRATEIQSWYDEVKRKYARQFAGPEAAARASAEVIEGLDRQAKLAKRRKLLQMQGQLAIVEDVKRFRDADKIAEAFMATIVRDDRAPYMNAGKQAEAIRARAHSTIRQIIEKHSRNAVTGAVRDTAGADDILREIMGHDTGNASAKVMAEAWTDAAENLRQRYNAAGGDIGKLEGGWFPQSHDSVKVRAVDRETWVSSIWDRLDRARMIDTRSGAVLDDEGLRTALDAVYDTIASDGWSKREPGGMGGRAMASRHSDHRFLHFKSAEDWLAYNADFGANSPFDAMMSHIEGMSRDIALMERFGPNPAATVKWMKDLLVRRSMASADETVRKNAARNAGSFQSVYDELAGAREPQGKEEIARFFAGVRAVEASAKLGGALLSAFSDTGFGALTRAWNGLPMMTIARDYLRTFKPASAEDRELAMYMGFGAQELAGRGVAQMRMFNEQVSGPVTHWLAERTIRLSGLSRWTNSGQWASGFGFVTHITMQRGKRFEDLNGAFRNALSRYGIDEAAWDHIRATPLEEHGGVPFIVPTSIEDQSIGDRLMRMILTEADFATPVIDLRTRDQVNSMLPHGKVIPELIRSSPLLFKTFGLSIWATHGRRMMEMPHWKGRMGYFGAMVTLTTAASAIALQMKSVKDGKDPREMDTPEFWMQASAQAGGFGPLGDYLYSATNGQGQGAADYVAGASLGTVGDIFASASRNSKKAWEGKETRVGKDAVKILKGNIPVASTLWYTKLAFDRVLIDNLQQATDPDYAKAWKRMEDFAEKQGTDYYWGPGQSLSDARSPDFSQMLGGSDDEEASQ